MSRENLSSTTPSILSSPASLLDMQWTVIFSIIFILFVLIRFLNAIVSRRAAKVVCSLGNAASVVSIQGARSYQEDKYVAKLSYRDDPHCAFFGVFDGHGGAKASDYLSQQLHLNVQRELQHNADVSEALSTAFLQTDNDFLKIANAQRLDDGSTAVCAYIHNGTCYVANTGDSRCVLASNGRAYAMSHDHKPGERLDEKARIEALGGKITYYGTWRVQGVLAVSRAFGDRTLKPYVIADPEIKSKKLEQGDDFLIIASDGVWDVISSQDAVDLVISSDSIDAAAKLIVDTASLRRSMDNITALIVDVRHFRGKKKL